MKSVEDINVPGATAIPVAEINTVERRFGEKSRGHFYVSGFGPDVTENNDIHESPWAYHGEVVSYYMAGASRVEGQHLANGGCLKAADMTEDERNYVQEFTYQTTGEKVILTATQQKAAELNAKGQTANVKRARSFSKFNGTVLASWLWIDIDRGGDLPGAHNAAKETLAAVEGFGIPAEHVQIRFSGSKGFHLLFPAGYVGVDLMGPQLAPDLSKRLSGAMPTIFKYADNQCYMPTQTLRLPNTRNPKSGLFCIPLTTDELKTLNIDQIRELARSPRNLALPVIDPWGCPPAQALHDRFKFEFERVEMEKAQRSGGKQAAGTNREKAIQEIIRWLDANSWPHEGSAPRSGDCTVIKLKECPIRPHASGGDQGAFFVFDSGSFHFSCLHAGCKQPKDARTGRDDYAARTQDAVKRISERGNATLTITTKRDYTELADGVAADNFVLDGIPTLRHHRATFHLYNGKGYDELTQEDLDSRIMLWLRANASSQATRTAMENIRTHLAAIGNVPSTRDLNTWIDDAHPEGDYMAFRNGILNVTAYLNEVPLEDCFYEHSPMFFSPPAVNYDFDATANCPRFLKFLDEVLPSAESRDFLQEFGGYTFTNTCKYQTMAFLFGKGQNGKNTLGNILAGLHSDKDLTSVPISSFGDKFALWPLATARLCYTSEVPAHQGSGAVKIAEEKLKSIVSGDLIQVERKNRDAFAVRPIAKLLFLGNELPALYDRSEGVWRRLVIIEFPFAVPQDKKIADLDVQLLQQEASGIFNWFMEGLKRLQARGRFIEPDKSRALKSEHRTSLHHEVQFLMDNYEFNPDVTECLGPCAVSAPALYQDYKEWADQIGFPVVGANKLGEAVKTVFPGVVKQRAWHHNPVTHRDSKIMFYLKLRRIDPGAETMAVLDKFNAEHARDSKGSFSPRFA